MKICEFLSPDTYEDKVIQVWCDAPNKGENWVCPFECRADIFCNCRAHKVPSMLDTWAILSEFETGEKA